jgi:hypothetical protein
MAAMGLVHIPAGEQGDEIIEEYRAFPTGRHDDRVDAAAHLARVLDMAHPAIIPVEAIKVNPSDYRPPETDFAESAWA